MYLKNQHFLEIINEPGAKISERLSSKAVEFFVFRKGRQAVRGIVYINTIVAEIVHVSKSSPGAIDSEDYVVVNNGGRYTNTTKKRINRALRQVGAKLYQDKGVRYIENSKKEVIQFENGMKVY